MIETDELERAQLKMNERIQAFAIMLLDMDGTILTWNQGAERMQGYTEQEIIGRNFSIFYTNEDRHSELPEKLIARATKEGRTKHSGSRVRKDGTIFCGSTLIIAIHDEGNQVIGFTELTCESTIDVLR